MSPLLRRLCVWEKLQGQVNGKKPWTGINALVAGNLAIQNMVSLFDLDIAGF